MPTGKPDATAQQVLETLRREHYDCSEIIVVMDGERAVGYVPLASLVEAAPDTRLADCMWRHFPIAHPQTDQEKVASLALHSQVTAVPVVDSPHRFVGVVPARSLLDILRREHVEDLHRLAGIARENVVARRALEAPPVRRARHRLPWLLVGLLGSAIAGGIVAQFDGLLSANIVLAFFIPGIVYLADAIGTQTEAAVVRGLSLSHGTLRQMLSGELRTGLLLGGVLGALAGASTWLGFQDARLAVTVASALLAAGAIATTIGLLLPWLLQRMGMDPAYGSGPLATVSQDVLSIAIYLLIASVMLG